MPDPNVSDVIASTRHAAPSPILPDPDLRAIDLAASPPGCLDAGERERFARAGQEALDACLRRFAPEERAAIWQAICRCYNRPYNPPEAEPAEALSAAAVPDPHVIEAVRPGAEAARPDALLR